jgi:hypothetical protein
MVRRCSPSLAFLRDALYLLVIIRLNNREAGSCHCFGSFSQGQVTSRTVVRNGLLLAGAVVTLVAAFRGHATIGTLLDASTGTWAWLLATVWALALSVTMGLARPVSEDYVRQPIPEGSVILPDGSAHTLTALAAPQARLLVFLSPGCSPCRNVSMMIQSWSAALWPIAVHPVLRDEAAIREEYAYLEPWWIFDDAATSAAAGLKIEFTPAAVVLGTDGFIAGGPVSAKATFARSLVS